MYSMLGLGLVVSSMQVVVIAEWDHLHFQFCKTGGKMW